jgi:exodeoxyribonuclease VII small subunit
MVASLKFETALSRLEELVRSMEKGDLSLEESLKRFEEGVRLSKNCEKILNEAEKKVEMLLSDEIAPTSDPAEETSPSQDDFSLPPLPPT